MLGLFILMIPFALYAQNIQVSGTVLDANNEPLPGVNVVQTGTTNGTITDLDGKYSLSVPSDATLTFSYIGFTNHVENVNGRTSIPPVVLESDDKELEQVVVVGYGTMKKSDVSGSVVSVDTKDMMKRAPVNIGQALQGVAAGVIVTAQDGAPDANSAVRIRGIATINGSADPLYVVDGVQVGTNANFINPSDIESIEVLKDASATAIYGSAGANGVIMITTKHGTKGHAQINVTADFGIETLPFKLKTLGIDKFASTVRESAKNAGQGLSNKVWDEKYDGKRTYIDWQDEMIDVAIRQQYGLSASGGTDKTSYNFSVGYLDYDGLVVNTNMNRLTARANSKTRVNNYIEVGGDINYVHTESSGSNAAIGNNGNLSSLRDFAYMTPTLDYVLNNEDNGTLVNVNIENSDGTYGCGYLNTPEGWEGSTSVSNNVYASQMEANGISKNNRLMASGFVDITLFKGFSIHSIASYTYSGQEGNDFSGGKKRFNVIGGKLQEIEEFPTKVDQKYNFSLNNSSSSTVGVETYATYKFRNDVHDFSIMVGNTVSKYRGQWVNAQAKDFPQATTRDLGLTLAPDTKEGNGAFNADSRMLSWFGRLTYSLFDRYILTATIRRDGSSNFSSGNRWGTFPSAALAWRISEEKFMENVEFINNLKFRLGWGQTGNAGNMGGKSITALKTANISYPFYTADGSLGIGTSSSMDRQIGYRMEFVDNDLKWETNEQTNIGVDLGLMKGQLNVTLDYFIRNTKDLLLNRSVRESIGYSSYYTNYGEIQNKGFEFSINYTKKLNKDWTVGVVFNGSTLKNEIKKMGDPIFNHCGASTNDGSNVGAVGDAAGFHWGNHSICKEGEAVGSFYGYVTDGIIQNEQELAEYIKYFTHPDPVVEKLCMSDAKPSVGDYKFKDLNGDGRLDENDMTVLGNGIPKFNYGITLNATYKNFDFSIYGYGVGGQKILSYSAMRLSTVFMSDDQTFPNLLEDSYDKVAHVENGVVTNPGATLPRLMKVDPNYNMRCSDQWVKKGNFFRLSNLQIGYTFDKELVNKIGLQNARVSFAIQNLAVFSKYKKYGDPEVGQGSVLFTGLDTGRFPMPRTFQFGVNLTF